MFRFDEKLKVYLHRDPVDFRYGMNSLSILVEQSMQLNPMDSSLYIFGNRRRDRIKILFWDGSGFWLMIKRLETSTALDELVLRLTNGHPSCDRDDADPEFSPDINVDWGPDCCAWLLRRLPHPPMPH